MISRISSSKHARVEAVRALEHKVAVVQELRREVGLAVGSAPRLRVSSLLLALAIAWRSSMSPSLTGTDGRAVVRRQALYGLLADEVGAGVAYVRDIDGAVPEDGGHQRRGHLATLEFA